MKKLMSSALLMLFSVCVLADKSVSPDVRIVNGEDANISDWPWMVSLQNETGFHFCGGSYIGDGLVVTAAHCVQSGVDHIQFGVSKLSQGKNSLRVPVRHIFSHENFSFTNLQNDIALLQLEEIPSSVNIQSIDVVTAAEMNNLGNGSEYEVAGWGNLEFQGSSPDQLQQTSVRHVSNQLCLDQYRDPVSRISYFSPETMICTYGGVNGGTNTDSCQGDSGGPLISRDSGQAKLVGIVSFGEGCAWQDVEAVYTKVAAFEAWLTPRIEWVKSGLSLEGQSRITLYENENNQSVFKIENESDEALLIQSIHADQSLVVIDDSQCAQVPAATFIGDERTSGFCEFTLDIDYETAVSSHLNNIQINIEYKATELSFDFSVDAWLALNSDEISTELSKTKNSKLLHNVFTLQSAPWQVMAGEYENYIQSAEIASNEYSVLRILPEKIGQLSLDMTVSSELNYDYFGVFIFPENDPSLRVLYSGDCSWQTIELTLENPMDYVDVVYIKDEEAIGGSDSASIKNIKWQTKDVSETEFISAPACSQADVAFDSNPALAESVVQNNSVAKSSQSVLSAGSLSLFSPLIILALLIRRRKTL